MTKELHEHVNGWVYIPKAGQNRATADDKNIKAIKDKENKDSEVDVPTEKQRSIVKKV